MIKSLLVLMVISLLWGADARAQEAGHDRHGNHSPYAGMQDRAVKALSDQQIADLTAGRGMSLALAAELNGFPGPVHVLELGDRLNLTSEQRSRTERLLEAMQAEASALGKQLIQAEIALDRLFSERTATEAAIAAASAHAAAIGGALRTAHLRYHLKMMDVLTAEQIATYVESRGYRSH